MQEHNPHTYTLNAEAETNALCEGFVRVIEQHIATHPRKEALLTELQQQQAHLEATHQDWIVDMPAKYNLKMVVLVLAAYRVLQKELPREETLKLIREAFIKPTEGFVRQFTRQMLDEAADPFQAIINTSKTREQDAFGKGFSFERAQDDKQAYLLNVKRCFYHRFFVANGTPELTRIFCDYDATWIGAIDPKRHGIRFERPSTLGYGATMCPFHFYRTGENDRA
uniref:L-2-amino-thiazoline-4-carboxylic acid hydrolase n=1 Tax=Thermosporothrix sp. COM3 TaxID=2490863 RepID=A0A455SFU5_9CHLR|nr:hypothetical protein KTC_20780 [Thermosporothrix sp. COM3]